MIVINIQCLQYVFYSLLSLLQKHRVCVKGHQNNLQTSKIIPRRDRGPRVLNSWIHHWSALLVVQSDRENRGPLSLQIWHDMKISPRSDIGSIKQRPTFCKMV